MKPWDSLTKTGQLRRLRGLAANALRSYPIDSRRLRLVGGFTNAIFRVDTDDSSYAIRVDWMQDHSDADVDIELAWLSALEATSKLDVARVVRATDGSSYVYASADGIPRARRCVLFRWIGGRPLGERPTVEGYRRLGALAASLHAHALDVSLPARPMAWDQVFYYPPSVDPVVIFDASMAHHFEGGRRAVLDRALAVVGAAFDRRDASAFRVLHGDLHPWNVHALGSRLIALDFEDVMWGHPIQDLAITLAYLDEHDDYAGFRSALEEGYTSVAPWPETQSGELECFIAARRLMFVNFVAHLKPDPSEYYAKTFPKLERFLEDWA